MYRQKGFTLIELVVVIVILGLLAATALPRFVDLTGDARLASVQGVSGGLRSGAALARAFVLVNTSSGGTIQMDGSPVTVNASGYPTADAAGIVEAVGGLPDGYSFTAAAAPTTGTAFFTPSNGGGATCRAEYTASNGTVVVQSAGCGG